MTTSDLLAELSNEAFKPDSDGERKICKVVLKLLSAIQTGPRRRAAPARARRRCDRLPATWLASCIAVRRSALRALPPRPLQRASRTPALASRHAAALPHALRLAMRAHACAPAQRPAATPSAARASATRSLRVLGAPTAHPPRAARASASRRPRICMPAPACSSPRAARRYVSSSSSPSRAGPRCFRTCCRVSAAWTGCVYLGSVRLTGNVQVLVRLVCGTISSVQFAARSVQFSSVHYTHHYTQCNTQCNIGVKPQFITPIFTPIAFTPWRRV